MAYKRKKHLANRKNYGGKRSMKKLWLVTHATMNDGDTDENNGKYFANGYRGASAHDFVDSDSVTNSVPYDYVAYSVGGKKYPNCKETGGGKYYGVATNSNTLNMELCDDVRNGKVYPSEKTIENAIEHAKYLMKKYNIPKSRVIRHFDVTGKACPAYWCGTPEKDKKWKTEFLDKLDDKETKKTTFKPYKVKVTANSLNVRVGAGTKYKKVLAVKKNEVYTIIATKMVGKAKWGKLKSSTEKEPRWVNLKYTKKC